MTFKLTEISFELLGFKLYNIDGDAEEMNILDTPAHQGTTKTDESNLAEVIGFKKIKPEQDASKPIEMESTEVMSGAAVTTGKPSGATLSLMEKLVADQTLRIRKELKRVNVKIVKEEPHSSKRSKMELEGMVKRRLINETFNLLVEGGRMRNFRSLTEGLVSKSNQKSYQNYLKAFENNPKICK